MIMFSFTDACKNGNIELVKEILKNNNKLDHNKGLHNACYSGHKDIAKLLIDNGANDYEEGLVNACRGTHLNIVELMISKGASNYNSAIWDACWSGSLEIIDLLISKGATNYNFGMSGAYCGGRKNIILLMILKGANIDDCFPLLYFEDIYYLLQVSNSTGKILNFGKYSNIVLECKKWKTEFSNVAAELFIKDVANLLIEY